MPENEYKKSTKWVRKSKIKKAIIYNNVKKNYTLNVIKQLYFNG